MYDKNLIEVYYWDPHLTKNHFFIMRQRLKLKNKSARESGKTIKFTIHAWKICINKGDGVEIPTIVQY